MQLASGVELFFAAGIFLVFILQVKFITSIKRYDPDLWEKLGRPSLFNPGSLGGLTFFVLFKEYASSKSTEVVRNGGLFRGTSLGLIIAAIVYFAVPTEVWYGKL